MTLCEEDCRLIDYNYETEKVKCSCDIKLSLPLFEEENLAIFCSI